MMASHVAFTLGERTGRSHKRKQTHISVAGLKLKRIINSRKVHNTTVENQSGKRTVIYLFFYSAAQERAEYNQGKW
jgi:hypothetical protein